MIDKEFLLESTEGYLKSLISTVAQLSIGDNDISLPFQELGIDSFRVLQVIKKLEEDFGTLPKTLLFENFNIGDLSHYFVNNHERIITAKFTNGTIVADAPAPRPEKPLKQNGVISAPVTNTPPAATPMLIPEQDAVKHPEWSTIVNELFTKYKNEGSSSRGTRNIAPHLFIGSEKKGYFNYSRSKNIILVYAYTGPKDYFPVLAAEIHQYCVSKNVELNLFASEQINAVGNTPFTATPFGVLSRITNIGDFTLEGSQMRRLRYQVSKFAKTGKCSTAEYLNGTSKETDQNIADIIDKWCAPRTMVNPLIHAVKAEILEGKLSTEHRLFLTWLDDVLLNVILISKLSSEENGYLMDLEFYPQEMPLGGLEFAIVKIMEVLASEGCQVLSLGGTYGCKLAPSSNADPELDKTLDYLREKKIFNDEGNLQFKNKFRPEHTTVFLCRAAGSSPDNVTDIIMMIADPAKTQTSAIPEEQDTHTLPVPQQPAIQEMMTDGDGRAAILADAGYNPFNIPADNVEFDLKSDSWAQLEMPVIRNQIRFLHSQLQQSTDLHESLSSIFPFSYFALTTSGRTAERAFFKSWPVKGIVLQNLLFPTTIFHQIDNGFTPEELPHTEVFHTDSKTSYKGNLNWDAFRKRVEQDHASIAFVIIEVDDNAAGGAPVSMQHLRDVKTLLAAYAVPLVIDGTRVLENAQFIIENEAEFAAGNIWEVAREMFSYADAVIASLTKDFCVNSGGLIATNNEILFHQLQDLIQEEGTGLDVVDKKVLALSLQHRHKIDTQVIRRMESVRLIWDALYKSGIPVVQPAGGHCILIDVKQVPAFSGFKYPVASFVAWMFLNTGIRAGAHNTGMQKNTPINDTVRLAIPIGLKRKEVDVITDRLIRLFERMQHIPELVPEGEMPEAAGDIHGAFRLIKYHHVAESVSPKTTNPVAAPINKTETAPSVEQPKEQHTSHKKEEPSGDIAVVGMAGRYPKAKNLGELWNNLVQGMDCIEMIPDDRFEQRLHNQFSEKYRGGFMDGVDRFDSLFFNISPREAEHLDPQERLFLEVAWETIEDAGYYPETLAQENESRNIGVYVGAVWTLYQMLGLEEKLKGNNVSPSSHLWGIANRVSYVFNLSGPSLSIDTACSSSLTAVHLACEAIRKGECSGAIVGGVNLDVHQGKIDINKSGGALSKDGVGRAFGMGANGYVAGEGVGAIFLKPLDQAVADGDHIYGIIKGTAVNHGGKTSGFMVPSPNAQAKVILSAIENANVDARNIGYVEAHGTGTELGDPVEISGLTTAFQKYQVDKQSCAVGTIKTNIGHLEAAAGIVGLHKVLLQMKHRKLVPSLHSAELNPFIDFDNSPFYVGQTVEAWKPRVVDGVELPLYGGISSFGAGGSNAHVIIEQYRQDLTGPSAVKDHIFPLSARNEDQLRAAAMRLRTFIQEDLCGDTGFLQLNINDIAHTLQIGRKSFDHRLVVIAKTKEELVGKLGLYIDDHKDDAVFTGQVKSGESITKLLTRNEKEEFIKILAKSGDLRKLAQLWTEGLLSGWQGMGVLETGRKISLPTYPFADKRHWISGNANGVVLSQRTKSNIHPLIDSNESTFERQVFKKTFHDRDFFIYDHLVSAIPTLPGVAYLDFARKAGELAAGRKVQKIRNILWLSPLTVVNSVPRDVLIELKPNGEAVQFEVFSEETNGHKQVYSQGKLLYATNQELAAAPEYIDFDAIRARCEKVTDGKEAYPLFKSLGLDLGPSFQVLRDIFKNEDEILGELNIPDARLSDFNDFLLHPSLVDGSFQAGMAAQLGAKSGEMFVPYSIGEVEVLQPLKPKCFSYVRRVNEPNAKVSKVNVLIVDENGMILVRIRESVGVPLVSVHEKPDQAREEEEYGKLYYSHEWQPSPLKQQEVLQGAIVLFAADDKLHQLYQHRFKDAGEMILVQPGDTFEKSGDTTYKINPHNRDDFKKLFESLPKIEKICFAWPMDAALQEESSYTADLLTRGLEKGIYPFLTLCQALSELKPDKVQLLYLFAGQKNDIQPHHEAINGFAKTLQLEYPKLHCKIVEVQQTSHDQILNAVLAELHPDTQSAMTVRYEEAQRAVRKVKHFVLKEPASPDPNTGLKEKGVYIITGGAGGLGLIFARYLAEQCNARLVLTGRSALSDEHKARLEALTNAGAEVMYVSADVAKYNDVEELVKTTRSAYGAINGIIHSAGVIRDAYIRNKTREEMEAVFAPKVYGTHHLDAATKDENLDFFVMFSSLAAVGGNVGQCDYAFANHFMDSFAAKRACLQQKGERSGITLSLNWSLWADGGMKPDEQTVLFFKKNLGIKPLSNETGLEAFTLGLHTGKAQFVVVEGVQEKIERTWGIKEKETPEPVTAPAASTVSTAAATPADEQSNKKLFNLVQGELAAIVMELLKLDAEDISYDKILLDLGFDSIGLTTYANRINDKYKLEVTPVLFFEYPSIKEIATFLAKEHKEDMLRIHQVSASPGTRSATPPPAAKKEPSAENAGASFPINKGWNAGALNEGTPIPSSGKGLSTDTRFMDMPIAIVGMSGVMPGSKDLEEFWENLEREKNLITEIPKDRWNWEDYDGDPFKEKNKTNSKWGGFMSDVDKFDPLFFGISPREAEMMDPQQRIFLETVWKAIEDSGHKVSDLSGTKTGLFVGVATRDYADILADKQIPLDGYTASGNSHSVLVNRVSFLLNLRGPSAPLDTACSSSLIAIHRAIESIHTGSCDMAIVGGVQLMLTPAAYISFGMAGMLSGDGKCKTFDKSANGYVRGEGSGAIFLKPLDKAEADRNHIYAVIRSTTENHGGRVTMLTAPNPVAQTDLLVEAYEKAQIDPSTVGYIECHGTGTSLGDPIEIQALNKTFAELYRKHNKVPAETPHCGLSSVKTNIGHLETAAGIAGVLKVLLSLQHKKIPACLHFKELNPYINLKGSPLYIVDKTIPWEAVKDSQGNCFPRRAGVSSFGFGGANAHIVLEEYVPKEHPAPVKPEGPHIMVLSAKNKDRLKAYAQLLYDHVEKHGGDLTDIAFTLQLGRDAMAERLGMVVDSIDQLKEKLSLYIAGEENIAAVFSGRVTQGSISDFLKAAGNIDAPEELVSQWFSDNNYTTLAEAWVKGVDIDWNMHYTLVHPRRISLPTYPFARERYWFNEADSEKQPSTGEFEKLHPLLHYNSSVFSQQAYTSNFSGKEFFIADHKIEEQKTLPVTAYLEMVRAAMEKARPEVNGSSVLELRNIAWGQLLKVSDNQQVSIALFESDDETVDYEIYSATAEEDVMHCSGRVVPGASPASAKLDILQLRTYFETTPLNQEHLYDALDQMGMSYGTALKSIRHIYRGDDQLLALLNLPSVVEDNHETYGLHPAMMEGALQVAICLLTGLYTPSGQPMLPFEAGSLKVFAPCRQEMYTWVRYARGSKPGDNIRKVDIDLTDKTGKVCVRIKSLAFYNTGNNQADKDFEMMLNTMQDHHSNGKKYAASDDAEISFDKLLKDLY